jgi:septal ring factor EnvC (AmiA/AmiB activator)
VPGLERALLLLIIPLMAAPLGLASPARAADSPEQQLKSVNKALAESRRKDADFAKQAQKLAAELDTLRENEVAAAKTAQDHEAALTALEDKLATLTEEAARKSEELKRRGQQQTQLLMALARLSRNPPEGLALAPGEPLDAVRSATLMGAAIPPIITAARTLHQEIDALALLRHDIGEAEARERAERDALSENQVRLAAMIARKSALQAQVQQGASDNNQRLLQLAAQATDLHQLIEKLDSERREREAEQRRQAEEERRAEAKQRETEREARLGEPRPDAAPGTGAVEVMAPAPIIPDPSKPKVVRPFAASRGLMVYPASGHLTLRYGENDDLGVASKGITLETRPDARVVAPFDGRILFAGPFRGYGQILIIEHSDGYHSLLAGLDRIEGTVGQWLVAGEPVGTMPGGDAKPRLYLELRHDGQPINPSPWLATRDEKVSG